MDFQSIKPLQERAKELQCLYEIENLIQDKETSFDDVFNQVAKIIPHGWQFPHLCHAVIELDDQKFYDQEIKKSKYYLSSELVVDNNIIGKVMVYYQDLPFEKNVFLAEEQKLLNTIAFRLSLFIFTYRLENTVKMLSNKEVHTTENHYLEDYKDEYWKWRFRMAENIVDKTDYKYYGIKAMYIIGSTKEATAGPASDIDLLVHFSGDEFQKQLFKAWIDGWSYSLEEVNNQNTGYQIEGGLIDLHLITDDDIKNKTSFAVMIGSLYNSARLLKKKE